jgi:DNA gyrase subunit A
MAQDPDDDHYDDDLEDAKDQESPKKNDEEESPESIKPKRTRSKKTDQEPSEENEDKHTKTGNGSISRSQIDEEAHRTGRIIDKEIKIELSTSYIDYAMSVIVGRAIADVRDGLKPVHRRILFSMSENNFFHNQPHKKCARIVGDVLGRYHPHGDTAVYDALVRMAQSFSMRYPLVDGQGNFGSVDGDAAAAMRYTEARLTTISEELLTDLDKDTVDFIDNFDGSLKEPLFLPSKIPNLLINGVTGIAVGMSTNIAPHNLREITAAICAAIDQGYETFQPTQAAQYIQGPDFPTGGIILGHTGINDAIQTGRGSIILRAKYEIQTSESGNKKDHILITELPYQVNKARLIENIAELSVKGTIPEISDVLDQSDRKGMCIYIELKKNADANAIINRLFMKTQLQVTFGIINLVLTNHGKQPTILNYAEIIKEFITHRMDVIRRRTTFDLHKAEKRLHLVEGLLIAINHIDEVVALIKNSSTIPEAEQKLITKFGLDEVQAQEILKMPLSRLTSLQTLKLQDEKTDLQRNIQELQGILNDRKKMLAIVKQETQELANKYGDDRRTEIQESPTTGSIISFGETVPEEQCVIVITKNQAIKRMTLENYQSQNRGGKGKKGMEIREEDLIQELFISSSHDTILLFTQSGRAYSLPAYQIPLSSRTAKGKAIVNYIKIQPEEHIIDIINVSSFDPLNSLLFISEKGTIKKTSLDNFTNIRSNGILCMTVKEHDELARVKLCTPKDHVIISTKEGFALHFIESELRPIGRSAMGVRGIRLRTPTDIVIDLVVCPADSHLLSITKLGFGKISPVELYRLTHRGGKGIINIKLRSPLDAVIAVKAVGENEDLLLASAKGQIIRIRAVDIRQTGRAAKGVILMRLEEGDSIISVAQCEKDVESEFPQAKLEEVPTEGEEESPEEEEEKEESAPSDNNGKSTNPSNK